MAKDVNKTDDGASSFAQADDKKGKCYCCGDEKCRLNVCKKKSVLPKEKWYKPECYVEQNSTHVVGAQVAEVPEYNVDKLMVRGKPPETSTMAFSGMQTHLEEKNSEEPAIMLDSGLTITIIKDKELMKAVTPNPQKKKLSWPPKAGQHVTTEVWRARQKKFHIKRDRHFRMMLLILTGMLSMRFCYSYQLVNGTVCNG